MSLDPLSEGYESLISSSQDIKPLAHHHDWIVSLSPDNTGAHVYFPKLGIQYNWDGISRYQMLFSCDHILKKTSNYLRIMYNVLYFSFVVYSSHHRVTPPRHKRERCPRAEKWLMKWPSLVTTWWLNILRFYLWRFDQQVNTHRKEMKHAEKS